MPLISFPSGTVSSSAETSLTAIISVPTCGTVRCSSRTLKPLIRTEGERALFELNRAALLYDMRQFREAADVVLEIRSLNPEFDAKCAVVKMKIMDAL